ncbi:hypothetical protein [Psychrobacter sp. ANT_H59]|uniref:hypothetical protein n=1 Tax=Psychrobacter sp. ANT_H59 TaxID=2597354 RepID=UPI0011EEF91E|nr:hypothetical protein [Psychrobacter sp. ANT_H59]KAA0939476.1 hypothetical protein FQ083_00345 [Psychrobacter sp. ANT_H59]
MNIDQNWLEMPENIRKKFDNSVWIPLRAAKHFKNPIKFGYEKYTREIFSVGSIAVPTENVQDIVDNYGWDDFGLSSIQKGYIHNSSYYQADQKPLTLATDKDITGIHLVLEQDSYAEDRVSIWHLNQDLVLTFDLISENDKWLSPKDGYIEVARIERNSDRQPILLEIKAEFLKDYLCARGMALLISAHYERDYITSVPNLVNWSNKEEKKTPVGTWKGHVIPIHEGGEHYGSSTAVFHMSRTDAHLDEDVPDISSIPTDDNLISDSYSYKHQGKKLYRYLSEYWTDQIIYPGKHSVRIREDELSSSTFFITDVDGSKKNSDDLLKGGKWLWFKPDVIDTLYNRRGGYLGFYTENTGTVSCCHEYGYNIHFGVNELGLITVYAKDIAYLPEWQRIIWQGYNISPDGGISKELHASQVSANPASTKAPESFILEGYNKLSESTEKNFNFRLFKEHIELDSIFRRIHRFRSLDQSGFFALAKDVARVTADNIDTNKLQEIVQPPKGQKLGSLKSLENFLAKKYDLEQVRKITAPLVGVYELRHADAHLPSSKISEAYDLVGIDSNQLHIFQALCLLKSVTTSLWTISDMVDKWNTQPDR